MADLAEGEIHRTEGVADVGGTNWYYVLHWGLVGGRAEVVGLEVWSVPPTNPERLDLGPSVGRQLPRGGAALTTSAVRALNVGSLINEARGDAIELAKSVIRSEFSERAKAAAATAIERMNRPGRPPKYDERHDIEVARVYQSAYEDNRSPTRAVARHFDVTEPQAAKWVSTARNVYHLLDETTMGRPSGVSSAQPTTERKGRRK